MEGRQMRRTVPQTWQRFEHYCTTGEFERLDRQYRRHCGPTAAANLILTLSAWEGKPASLSAQQVFRTCAKIGQRRMIYMNLDLFGCLGGTSDLLAGVFLDACLKAFGIEDFCVLRRRRATEKNIRSALGRGSLLYLELRRHPKYGNHHLLCYGAQLRRDAQGRNMLFLRCADGWVKKPCDLPLSDLPHASVVEIGLK